ncbi:MAG: MaoC family dehydratase [Ideonella sp.]|nr:MaoC family dehydratase [Ideonella sp.]MCC7459242.1 MaoC family dehydratase [Nitrospira sp.]
MATERMNPAELAAHLGEPIGTSSWITIDQQRIDEFAHCTGDHQWIHVDAARAAKESPFGTTVAHGFLTLALLAPASFEILMSRLVLKQALNYGLEKARFLSPVRAGKRVRLHLLVGGVEDKGGGRVLLTLEVSVEIEGEDKPALIATSLAMLMD